MLGVLLRAIYGHIILIIQLLLSGGITQGLGLRVGRGFFGVGKLEEKG